MDVVRTSTYSRLERQGTSATSRRPEPDAAGRHPRARAVSHVQRDDVMQLANDAMRLGTADRGRLVNRGQIRSFT
jgi:hypothetical protein